MNTQTLEYITAIAETGSVSAAASRFFLSRPALTKHLRKVEEEIGTPLFCRKDKKLELTPAGVIYVNNASAILQVEAQLRKDLEKLKLREKEGLTLFVDPSLVNFIVRKVVPVFHEKYPQTPLEIKHSTTAATIRALKDGSAQLGILNSHASSVPGLSTFIMMTDEFCPVFPDGSQAADSFRRGDYASPAFGDLTLAVHSQDRTWAVYENECLKVFERKPDNIVEIGVFAQILDYVRSGNTMGFLPLVCLRRNQHPGYTVCHMDPPFLLYSMLAVGKNRMLSTEEQNLMNIILDENGKIESYFARLLP